MVHVIQEGGVPIKAWIDGVPLEDAAKAQLRNVAAHAVHPSPYRRHARCPLGHGRDRRLRHPDKGRDHPGGGRRRYRLRHDRVADHLTASDLPDNLHAIRDGDRERGSAWAHR